MSTLYKAKKIYKNIQNKSTPSGDIGNQAIIAVKDNDELKVKRKNKRNINIKTCALKHLPLMLSLES